MSARRNATGTRGTTAQGSVEDSASTGTRASAKRDAEQRIGNKPEER